MSTATIQTADPDIVRDIVHALGDRPYETAEERERRSHSVERAVRSFQPRGSVETMFAGLAVTHFALIVDSARDALRGPADNARARTKSTLVSLDRMLTTFLKELPALVKNDPPEREEDLVEEPPAATGVVTEPAPAVSPPVVSARKSTPSLHAPQTSVAALMTAAAPAPSPRYKITGQTASAVPPPDPMAGIPVKERLSLRAALEQAPSGDPPVKDAIHI